MYQIIFKDSIHGEQITHFDSFDDALEYWDFYADVDTCIAGELKDLDNEEIIWGFSENG